MPYRLTHVNPQKVWGGVPLQLPLIKMSQADALMIHGPQIYDKNYPLDYDGLMLDPAWNASPYYMSATTYAGPGNVKVTKKEAAELHGLGFVGGFGALGLTPAQLAAQQARAAQAAAQAKARADAAAARQAQQAAAQAAKLAQQQAAAKAKSDAAAAKQAAAQAASDKRVADAAQKKADAAKKVLDAAHAKFQAACAKGGGVWDPNSFTCDGASTLDAYNAALKTAKATQHAADIAQKQADATQKKSDAADARAQTAQDRKDAQAAKKADQQATQQQKQQDKQTQAQLKQAQAQCKKQKGIWDFQNQVCNYPPVQCSTGLQVDPTTGQCVPIAGATQCPAGYAVDPISGQCTPVSGGLPPQTQCPTIQVQCQPGTILSPDANGCYTSCVPDPNYQQQMYPPQTYPPQSPYPPQVSPYPDPSQGYGGGGGGGAPMMPDMGGGGMPMTQSGMGPGPQLNDQANQFADSVQQSDQTTDDSGQTPEEAAATQDDSTSTDDSGDTSDATKVAGDGILDSLKKFLSGGNGMMSGLGAPPPTFNVYAPGNSPLHRPIVAQKVAPVKRSTTSGVLLGSLVLVVGAAAIYLNSKGKKK